ncbi:hypothetical protein J5N97_018258 [Dioscorea zingiberensis]|uniref:Uncharacterized protein n=1 Tax=Dioscorea zingiberensis TaxID=325984 RepID=A0A9D5HH75_9LILI|nr:hypothetical protein J5N97_018258 [Dioscorea zingiberensis]
MREEGKEGSKRRPWMRLEVSGGGGILVLGGVIIAAAWAAHRRHVNRERNKRRTTQGTGDEAEYEQYHKEKEEEVKDSSKDKRFGEISAAVDDGLLEIKKVGSVPLIEEQTAACSFDDDGTELCVCQSHTEKTEEAEGAVEKIEMVVNHVEEVEGKDGGQEVGEEKVNSCNKDDGCDEVGEGDALNQVPIHVEDDTKQVDKEEEEEERDLSSIDVLSKDESFATVLMPNIEVLEDLHNQREEVGEEKVNSCNKDDGCEEVGEGDALKQVPIHVEDDTKQVDKEEDEEERDLSSIDVLSKDESFATVLMPNIEVLEDVHNQREEVGEEKVNSCNKDDGCDEVGEVDALKQVPIHVEDDTKQVDKDEEEEEERDLSFIDVLPKDESFVTVSMANIEVLEDVHHQREEEEEVHHKEEECNSEEEEEPETESYEEEIEPLVEEEIEKGGEELQVQANEAYEDKEESFSNVVVPKGEEFDAKIEQVEEETELTANTEEVEGRVIECNEEETESSDDSGVIETDATEVIETDETDETDATEELEAVWPAEIIETDETENQMKINDNSGQATMKKVVITMDKKKGKEFLYMMSHSRSMFLLVLAMALALCFLSFQLSQFTVA